MSIVTLTMNPTIDVSADAVRGAADAQAPLHVGAPLSEGIVLDHLDGERRLGDFIDAMPLGLPCRVNLAGSKGTFGRLICINDPAKRAGKNVFG